MKKLRISIILGLLVLTFAALIGCGTPVLNAPENLVIENKTLTWDAVDGARGYTVDINGVERDMRRTSFSFAGIRLEEGTYTFRVKARGNGVDYADSDWTTVTYYQKYESGLVYELSDEGDSYILSSVGTAKGDVVIADTYNDLPVVAVGDYAFANNLDLTSVKIGDNVTSIGTRAFYGCTSLEDVTIPNGVTSIGDMAFQSCHSLTNVVIPDSVTYVGVSALAYCKALSEVTLGNGIEILGESAFKNCGELLAVTVPESMRSIGNEAYRNCGKISSLVINSHELELGESVFRGCSALASVDLGDCVTALGNAIFADCTSLTSIILPDTVTAVGDGAFSGCTALADVKIGSGITAVGSNAFYNTAVINASTDNIYILDRWIVGTTNSAERPIVNTDVSAILNADVIGIADYAFSECFGLTSIRVPQNVKYIGRGAFYNCIYLMYVIIGDKATDLGYGAFYGCTSLLTVNLGLNMEHIGPYAFAYCENLTCTSGSVTIHDKVTSIGTYAFYKTALWNQATAEDSVNPDGVMYIGKWVVGCDPARFGSITVTDGTVGIADYAFTYCSNLEGVKLPDSVRYLGTAAFYGCTGYAGILWSQRFTVNIPNGITEIRPYTFYGAGMWFLHIPSTVTKIGYAAFAGSEIMDVRIPDSVTEIAPYAFFGCKYLTSVTLNDKITEIPERTFSSCTMLSSVVIPASVTSIGERAFFRCDELASVRFDGDALEEIGEKAFYLCPALTSIVIPDSVKKIGAYAFYKCERLESVKFGSHLDEIGEYAFYYCHALTSLDLPDSLTKIGNSAFRYCRGLTNVTLGGYITNIGEHAFYGIHGLTLYCEASDIPPGWVENWNSMYRPVVLGVVRDMAEGYIVSVNKSDSSLYNYIAEGGIAPPSRDGYDFVGWATAPNAATAEYSAADIAKAPNGMLYAVWTVSAPEEAE